MIAMAERHMLKDSRNAPAVLELGKGCCHLLMVSVHVVQVQQEDIALCEAVQRGLRSPAYDSGRCTSIPHTCSYQQIQQLPPRHGLGHKLYADPCCNRAVSVHVARLWRQGMLHALRRLAIVVCWKCCYKSGRKCQVLHCACLHGAFD